MRVQIMPGDDMVAIGDRSFNDFDMSEAPGYPDFPTGSIHCIHWDTEKGQGEVEFSDDPWDDIECPNNEKITTLPDWANNLIDTYNGKLQEWKEEQIAEQIAEEEPEERPIPNRVLIRRLEALEQLNDS